MLIEFVVLKCADDFTRYTLSDDKQLFSHASKIDSGMVAGLGFALVWLIVDFEVAFVVHLLFRNTDKAVICKIFFWLKYFDLLLKVKPAAIDVEICTRIFGHKIEGHVSDTNFITSYLGTVRMRDI